MKEPSTNNVKVQRWVHLSPLWWLTSTYIEFFKEYALDTAPLKTRHWKRYVDNTCCIVKKGKAEGHLDHLNSVRPSLLWRKEDVSLDITVYKKPTHTDHYLDFQSPLGDDAITQQVSARTSGGFAESKA